MPRRKSEPDAEAIHPENPVEQPERPDEPAPKPISADDPRVRAVLDNIAFNLWRS